MCSCLVPWGKKKSGNDKSERFAASKVRVHTELGEVYAVLKISDPGVGAHVPEYREYKRHDHQEAEHEQPCYLQHVGDHHELKMDTVTQFSFLTFGFKFSCFNVLSISNESKM